MTMKFEFDQAKSQANKADPNRKLDFVEAQVIWQSTYVLLGSVEVENDDGGLEVRDLTVGVINGKKWLAVTTKRDEVIRIISVRRARENEEKSYDKAFKETSEG